MQARKYSRDAAKSLVVLHSQLQTENSAYPQQWRNFPGAIVFQYSN